MYGWWINGIIIDTNNTIIFSTLGSVISHPLKKSQQFEIRVYSFKSQSLAEFVRCNLISVSMGSITLRCPAHSHRRVRGEAIRRRAPTALRSPLEPWRMSSTKVYEVAHQGTARRMGLLHWMDRTYREWGEWVWGLRRRDTMSDTVSYLGSRLQMGKLLSEFRYK